MLLYLYLHKHWFKKMDFIKLTRRQNKKINYGVFKKKIK